jgi:hypothetical protein
MAEVNDKPPLAWDPKHELPEDSVIATPAGGWRFGGGAQGTAFVAYTAARPLPGKELGTTEGPWARYKR